MTTVKSSRADISSVSLLSERSVEIDTRTDRVSEFLTQLVLSIRQKKKQGQTVFTFLRGLLIITSFPTVINTKNSIASAPQHYPSRPPGKLLFCFTRLEKWSQLKQIKAQVTKCCLKAISGLSLRYAQYARLNVYFKPTIFLSCVCLFFKLCVDLRPQAS